MQKQRTDLYLFDICLQDLKKCQVSFRLYRFEFTKSGIEYAGNNIMQDITLPVQSKVNMTKYCKLTESGKSIHYFIGLDNLYLRYTPYFETRLKSIRNI